MQVYYFHTQAAAREYLKKPHMELRPYQLSRSACDGRWVLEFEADDEIGLAEIAAAEADLNARGM